MPKYTQVKDSIKTTATENKIKSARQSFNTAFPMKPASDALLRKSGKTCYVRTSANAKTYVKYSSSAKSERDSIDRSLLKLEQRVNGLGAKVTVQKDVTEIEKRKKEAAKSAKKKASAAKRKKKGGKKKGGKR